MSGVEYFQRHALSVPLRRWLIARYPRLMRLGRLLAVFVALIWALGCKRSRDLGDVQRINLDLRNVAPIGYEICASRPPTLQHANLNLELYLPQKLDLPPDAPGGVKYIEFPGQHDVDVYRNLTSTRLLYTKGDLTVKNGTLTLRTKLEMARLPKGQYVLGISGDPFFAYCTVNLK